MKTQEMTSAAVVEPRPMKIELKKFTANTRFSEETLMFRAEVWANGKKAGTVENYGRGGSTFTHYFDRELGERIRAFIKTLPPEASTWDDDGALCSESGKPPSLIDWTEDYFFSSLAEKMLKAKGEARIQKWLIKQADAVRAKGFQPRKFTLKGPKGTSFVVLGLKASCTAKDVQVEIARLAEKYKATVTGGEAI